MAVGKQASKLAEIILALREKHGSDVVDLILWVSPKVPDAIMLGRHKVVISNVHPSQVRRLIACLRDLSFTAEAEPADSGETVHKSRGDLTHVVVRWCPVGHENDVMPRPSN